MAGREELQKDRKTERRAQALRDNLKRRKAQARERAQSENEARGRAQAKGGEKVKRGGPDRDV